MLIITLAPIAITVILADNIPTSSSVIGKTINPFACDVKASNVACKKLLIKVLISKMNKELILKLVTMINRQKIN